MKEKFNLNVSDDVLVQGYIYKPKVKEEAKAIIILCHGMAEHIKRYDNFLNILAQNNFIVFAYDQRGHGMTAQSKNDLGYMSDVDNLEALVSDLYSVSKHAKALYPDLDIYILGHSMGSFVTQRFIQLYGNSIKGVILSGSALNEGIFLNFGILISKIIILFYGRRHRSKLVHKFSLAPFNKPFQPERTEVDWLSRDNEVVDKYIADPLCGQMFTVSYFLDLAKLFKKINKGYELIPDKLQILMISGSHDPVGGMGKLSTKLYNKFNEIGIKDLTFKLYDEGRHEMLNEINKEEVYTDILEWLNNHI